MNKLTYCALVVGLAGLSGFGGSAVFNWLRPTKLAGKPFSLREWSPVTEKHAKDRVPIGIFAGNEGLATIIAKAAGKPRDQLTYGDIEEIQEITLDYHPLHNTSGIELLTGLQSLSANSCGINDISSSVAFTLHDKS